MYYKSLRRKKKQKPIRFLHLVYGPIDVTAYSQIDICINALDLDALMETYTHKHLYVCPFGSVHAYFFYTLMLIDIKSITVDVSSVENNQKNKIKKKHGKIW